mmetsp:Transcript_67969/g.212615  ORF Transcript_67969/g.212615 Transcript_67969/m.212615 type:complete len:249 (+) Transcript_67969:416-1162(+)
MALAGHPERPAHTKTSTPAALSRDPRPASTGTSVSSAAGRNSSQAPRDTLPKACMSKTSAPGGARTARAASRRFTAEPARPMACMAALRTSLPPEERLSSEAMAAARPSGGTKTAAPLPLARSCATSWGPSAEPSVRSWRSRPMSAGGTSPMSAAQSHGKVLAKRLIIPTALRLQRRTRTMPSNAATRSAVPPKLLLSAITTRRSPRLQSHSMLRKHMMQGLRLVAKTAFAQSGADASWICRRAPVSP